MTYRSSTLDSEKILTICERYRSGASVSDLIVEFCVGRNRLIETLKLHLGDEYATCVIRHKAAAGRKTGLSLRGTRRKVASSEIVKPCVKCGASDRYKDDRCKPCAVTLNTAWKMAFPQRRADSSRIWRESNKDALKDWQLRRDYGITLEQYRQMLITQNNRCAGCLVHANECTKALAVDHDHTSGRIRGLLCFGCNALLGKVKDDPMVLERLVKYLRSECTTILEIGKPS